MDVAPGGGNRSTSSDLAARGWASRLAAMVVALLAVEALTGLWIYLAPFSVASQLQVVLHTVVGVAVLVPYAWYQVRHFMTWSPQKLSAVKALGYLLMVMVVVCFVSGIVLTLQSATGPKRSETWDLIHLVTGIVTTVLLAIHLVLAMVRRRGVAAQSAALGLEVRRFTRTVAVWAVPCLAIVVTGAYAWKTRPVERALPQGYSLPKYAQEFDEYRNSAFAPTYARTQSGMLVDPEVLSHSASCGSSGCHNEILDEWLPSAHRFSAMNAPFQVVQKNFATDREPAETRYCAGCHDPISLFAGAKDVTNLDLSAPGMQEGSSCVVCHSISKVDSRGNADYVLTPPHKYLGEHADGVLKLVSDFLIRAYPQQHLADYDRNLLRTPEFCGACHKQFVPEALNRFGVSPAQNQYDEWKNSRWHTPDSTKDLACRDCHMRLVRNSTDPGRGEERDPRRSRGDGAHRHHGTIGTNMFMPGVLKLPHWERQVDLTNQWIRGETVIPEIADVWPKGPVATVELFAPATAIQGEIVALRAVVTNRKAGHNFITGPLDFMRSWVHLQVTDAAGRRIAEWGSIDPVTRDLCDTVGFVHEAGNSREQGTLVLEALPVGCDGQLLLKHELWTKAGGKGQRVIFPRHSDSQMYRFRVPRGARGPLTATAELSFRRYRQQFLNLVVPTMERDSDYFQPTVTQDSDTIRIGVTGAPRAPRAADVALSARTGP